MHAEATILICQFTAGTRGRKVEDFGDALSLSKHTELALEALAEIMSKTEPSIGGNINQVYVM